MEKDYKLDNETLEAEREHEVDRLADLGVPEVEIEKLRVEDLKQWNYRRGAPKMTDRQLASRQGKLLQRKLAKYMAVKPTTGMTTKECMKAAGYSDAQTRHTGVVKSATNSVAFTEELAKHDIGPRRIAELIEEGLGQEDHGIRLKYVDRALDITGAKFAPQKTEEAPVSVTFIKVMKLAEKLSPEAQQAIAEGDFSSLEEVPAEYTVKDEPKK